MADGGSPDRILYDCGSLRIGSFRLRPDQRPFEDTGPIQGFLLVYPRTSVIIEHAGRAPVVADPTKVMLYNRGQEYRRRALTEIGDACEWFSFPPELVVEAMRSYDPSAVDRPERPFRAVHAATDADTYLLQRRIVEHVLSNQAPDRLLVEESMMRLLSRAVSRGTARADARRRSTIDDHRAIADACRRTLARHFADSPSLEAIASNVGVSPFHLARVFHRESGMTLHGYVHELRLRTALERVAEGEELARVALDLGFANHSHFTAAFRRLFGVTPTGYKRSIRARS
jgi:AraC-like DNA-binding protein